MSGFDRIQRHKKHFMEWDESKHARDGGKFAPKEGVGKGDKEEVDLGLGKRPGKGASPKTHKQRVNENKKANRERKRALVEHMNKIKTPKGFDRKIMYDDKLGYVADYHPKGAADSTSGKGGFAMGPKGEYIEGDAALYEKSTGKKAGRPKKAKPDKGEKGGNVKVPKPVLSSLVDLIKKLNAATKGRG